MVSIRKQNYCTIIQLCNCAKIDPGGSEDTECSSSTLSLAWQTGTKVKKLHSK
ncbi:hypothetical protein EXN66_Car002101 [Channa argus]|uniref:Uncharacterized protein n=1 Tax=Channa argus TaxID=215402 RepID=A0A6G1P892_CHAAH|nr:hypothetical protein EXN66_Car002101 [Channa argus]